MSEERPERTSTEQAKDHADSKTEEERKHEQEWSQGGQDVEEEQHQEPGASTPTQ
jgi:hypothetical protein